MGDKRSTPTKADEGHEATDAIPKSVDFELDPHPAHRGRQGRLFPELHVEGRLQDHEGPEPACIHCPASCCNYISVPIDAPTSLEDFDDIRWYVSHRNVSVFRLEKEWYVNFHTVCEHLDPKGLCGIYPVRPEPCRDLDWEDCEETGVLEYEYFFDTVAKVDRYLDQRWPRRGHSREKETLEATKWQDRGPGVRESTEV